MQGSQYRPKVFISHSTKVTDPLSVCFLDRLHQALSQARDDNGTATFEVLLDRENLLTGEKWREVIREWMLSCDAAIVLISEAATSSDYVKQELTLLQERQRSHPNSLMLLPVSFPTVTEEHLKERMGPQQITERQIQKLTGVWVRSDRWVRVRLIGVWAVGAKEVWWLATNLGNAVSKVVGYYDRRMGVEEQFRDAKGVRFGVKLRWTQFTRPEFVERMYLLVGVALLL